MRRRLAIDSVAALMIGFKPMEIPYLRMCHDRGLGVADPERIEVVGEDISTVDFGFESKKSFVIWGDQMLRHVLYTSPATRGGSSYHPRRFAAAL